MLRRILRAACACLYVAPGLSHALQPRTQAVFDQFKFINSEPVRNTSSSSTWGLSSQTGHLTVMFNHQEGAIALSSPESGSNRKALAHHRNFTGINPTQQPWQEAR
jgi:hypothetical protein